MFSPFMIPFGISVFRGISLLLSIILLIVLSLTLFKSDDERGFKGAIIDFFTFKKFCLGTLIKIAYGFSFLYFTILGLLLLFFNPVSAFFYLIVCNLVSRIGFELVMIFIRIEENTRRPRGNCDCGCDCDYGCDCDCDDECGCSCGCDCGCMDDFEIEDIYLDDEDIIDDEEGGSVLIEDITDEVVKEMEEKPKKTKAKKETK